MSRRYVVPGRVELVGKHVDYAGGRSLTCAVDLAIQVRASPNRDAMVRVRDSERRGQVEVPLSESAVRRGPLWSAYVAAVARRFARDFPASRTGVDIRLRSQLPPSSGLSSSSALVVAIGMALVDANDMENSPVWREAVPTAIARAEYFSAIETGAPYGAFAGDAGVGVRGGAQDHVAIVCAAASSVGQFSYLPATLQRRVPWPGDYVIAIGVSGIRATKSGNAQSQYNRASDALRALARGWNSATGRNDLTIADALATGGDAGERLARLAADGVEGFGTEYLAPRLAQFREEVEVIVPGVGDALRDRDFAALGALVDRSQPLAEQALGNQVPETIFLARAARECGAVAASAFGAGFGGAVWAMVRGDEAAAFVAAWRAQYAATFPARAGDSKWLVTRPSGPARELVNS